MDMLRAPPRTVPFRKPPAGFAYFGLLISAALLIPGASFACDACGEKKPLMGPRVEYDLYIEEKSVSPAGKPAKGITINGGIPGPTLRFREGDVAVIRVHNRLRDEETSAHWHGLLLPHEQDGVPYVNTPPILPGKTHTFEFKLRHSGTSSALRSRSKTALSARYCTINHSRSSAVRSYSMTRRVNRVERDGLTDSARRFWPAGQINFSISEANHAQPSQA